MADGIYEIPSTTPNLQSGLAQKLQELVPEAIADGKVDVAKLTELLADDAADSNERFGLFWPGKKRALRAAQKPTTATLRPDKANSKDWDTTKNVFIEGDNLEVLKILQKHYHGRIKMIYIDPPYNTGKDFVYPDNYKEGLETYLEWTKQVNEEGKKVSTNSESEGRYHSNWLNMMYPRLKLARNLLTDDGVIFISIDDNEIDNLVKLGKEVFGEANYLNTFVWVSNLKGRQISASGAARTKEYIVVFARKADQVGEFRASANDLKAVMPSIYKGFNYEAKQDEYGPYVTKNELYNTNSAFNEATRSNLVFDIYYRPDDAAIRTEPVSDNHVHDGFEKISPKKNNNGVNKYHAYRWSTSKIAREPHNLEFVQAASGWKIFTKVRDVDSTTVKDLVMDITTSAGAADISALGLDASWFDYPKPLALIKSLVRFGADPDSIVLDFFAGSGTTAQAVLELNAEDSGDRRFIQVQLPEPLDPTGEAAKADHKTIADIARARIAKVLNHLEGQLQGKQFDLGFRSFKLVDTNFTKWRLASDVEPGKLEQHLLSLRDSAEDDATPDALLTELLIKQGYSLTEETSELDVAGLRLRSVGSGLLLAYLDEHNKPTLNQLREVVDQEPARFVILEDAFQGDDELKTNLAQLCKSKAVELWTA
ncbi:DNA methyltransferase [Mycolicibacterium setense]|uniref:site-specific DNA-methyltransferase n=1 Tax=Mycolicibacterium setense TaxID=431269 RepID=UPI0003A5CDE3|nr:site-specific DNA-methyltransferase [Mycolicibacterium setense]OBB19707.1 DNA methyltransferase [Mycolicibacterium setense]